MKTSIFFKINLAILVTGMFLNSSISAQNTKEKVSFPETEIFLLDLKLKSGSVEISNSQNITARSGYDNQPYFTKDNEHFLYSRDDGYQTDIYEYSLSSKESVRLTKSDNTEFSPTPFLDGINIAFVSDRNNSIWSASRDNIDSPKWVFANNPIHEPIGYFSWNHDTGYILYWSQYGHSVTLTHESAKEVHYVSGNAIPSTPHIIPETNRFSFVHRQANGVAWIKELDPVTKSIRPITPIVATNANYAWAPDGSILMVEANYIYRWQSNNSTSWEKVADLTSHGIRNANRLAISPNGKRIAIVGLPALSLADNN